jgi:hypothetical protein
MSGEGWSCKVNDLTCTRTTALAAGGSFPITVTGNLGYNEASIIVNEVDLSAGSGPAIVAGDPTTLVHSCEVTHDAVASVADVQRVLRESLGAAPLADDLNLDGAINVVDVQIVIAAARGQGCTAQ